MMFIYIWVSFGQSLKYITALTVQVCTTQQYYYTPMCDSHGESRSVSEVQMRRIPFRDDAIDTSLPYSPTTHCQLSVQDLQGILKIITE